MCGVIPLDEMEMLYSLVVQLKLKWKEHLSRHLSSGNPGSSTHLPLLLKGGHHPIPSQTVAVLSWHSARHLDIIQSVTNLCNELYCFLVYNTFYKCVFFKNVVEEIVLNPTLRVSQAINLINSKVLQTYLSSNSHFTLIRNHGQHNLLQ